MKTSIFDNIKHIDENGNEYWLARELQNVLEYTKWQNFEKIILKSKTVCSNSCINIFDQFTEVSKLIIGGKGNRQKVNDYKLSRYACYLIVMNGDPRKEVIALGQSYFAVQTRKQELFEELSEDDKRLIMRERVKKGNLGLTKTALISGVKNMAEFHNAGYKGLYNGETADDIFKRKKLRYREDILDNMGSVELGANLFRITQTDDKLKKEKVDNEYKANLTHYDVGRAVRDTIKKIGGTMPEELETPKKSIKEIKNL